MNNNYKIIQYENHYEKSWLRCRVLSFLDSAYYDDVHIEKEKYENPSIALIAVSGVEVVGFLDMEYELEPNTICSKNLKLAQHLAGMIWHLGVHPDYRKQGIAKKMLEKAVESAKEKDLKRLEAWTRDDEFVCDWYEKNGFELTDEYIHWYYDSYRDDTNLLKEILKTGENIKGIVKTFGHAKKMTNEINLLKRKYYCRRFDKIIG